MTTVAIELPVLDCNKCGECCRQGGSCYLRQWDASLNLRPEFDGVCELLDGNECGIMLRGVAQGDGHLLKKFGIVGTCNFPHLRKEEASLHE